MNKLIKVVCLYFFIKMRPVDLRSLNLTNLLISQLTMCGPENICNISQFSYINLNFKISKSHKLCPDCFCDNFCFGRGDCCPDKYFALSGLVCDNVTSVNATQDQSRDQRSSFLMIKNCPNGTDQLIKEKCVKEADSVDKLKYPPVTSVITNLTYANRFCAQCTDETSYQIWNLDIYCRIFLDINFLSSFKEVVDNSIEHKCILQFEQHDDKPAFNCYRQQEYHFESCNKTGFWKTRNDDVLYACESVYANNDSLYKNSFCRMCNPTFYEGDVITQCNVTGLWNFFDKRIKEACSRFELNEGTLPFKNVFCRVCNAPENMKYSFVEAFAEISTNVLFKKNGNNIYHIFIKMNNFYKDFFNYLTNNIPESEKRMKQRTTDISFHKNQNLNLTELMYKSFSLKKYVGVCNNYSIPKNFSRFLLPCTCQSTCFHYKSCCEDFAVQYPTKCVHSKQLAGSSFKRSNSVKYLVTSGCYMLLQYELYKEKKCKSGDGENNTFSDIFSSFPVRDLYSGISYLNMYCYLCNTSPYRSFDLGKPWDIKLYCEKYVEHGNFILIKHLLKTIIETKCDVTYLPDSVTTGYDKHSTPECHPGKTRYNGICNSTEKWLVEDPDIKYACENVSSGALNAFYPESDKCELPFKNVFCALCNPEVVENISISECSVSGNDSYYSELDDVGCHFFPKVNFYSPFKNLFCKHCNNQGGFACASPYNFLPEQFVPKLFNWFPIYRNLFVYSGSKDEFFKDESPSNCNSTEKHILKNQCRNLTCHPGKYLLNGTCQALFTVTKNLGYFLTLDFKGNISSLLPVHGLLLIISEEFKQAVISKLQIGSNSIEYLVVQIDQPCLKKNEILFSQKFSGSIAVGIFIKQAVERVDIEKQLIAIATQLVISKIDTYYLHLSFSMCLDCFYLSPYKINLADYFSRCTLQERVNNQVVENRQKYRTVRVSKLLTCVQVLLEFDEYHIDKQSEKLTLFGLDKMYDNDLFDILPDGSARICAEDFNIETNTAAFSSYQQDQVFLWKITLILNVISIFCLIISFLIYVLKKELRTMPGKVNMILILSLAFTLILFMSSKLGKSQKEACVALGIALHYFWLMSFSSMTVSSFHMFRIFKFSRIYTSNGCSNIFRLYIAFITIFPFLAVVFNVIISWRLSGNGEIGYGNTMCFIDNTYSRLASFIIPVGIMCLCSLFFFVSTIISIKRVPKVPENQSVRNEFGIFCRLFTITGITWVLQIFDGFLPFTTFSYISSIINSLQGTAIFIAFVLNKRIINCKCTTREDSYNKTLAKTESTEESYTDVTRL